MRVGMRVGALLLLLVGTTLAFPPGARHNAARVALGDVGAALSGLLRDPDLHRAIDDLVAQYSKRSNHPWHQNVAWENLRL